MEVIEYEFAMKCLYKIFALRMKKALIDFLHAKIELTLQKHYIVEDCANDETFF